MTKRLYPLLLAFAAAASLTSCLSDTDDDVTYYDDTAITAFTLGTINRYNHTTKADGSDSTYVTKVTGSNYACYIDQLNAQIYNPDSLPKNCDAKHVVCTFSTKNGGLVVVTEKNVWGEDSLAYYSTGDSLDLSTPMKVKVYSNRGTSYKEYTLTLNVHQQTGDEFAWSTTSADGADALGARRFAQLGDEMWMFCQDGQQTTGYHLTDGTWQQATTLPDAQAYANTATLGDKLYTLYGGTVYSTADGTTWTAAPTPGNLKQLVGSSDKRLYALTDNGIAYTTDGQNWTDDTLDSAPDSLPATDINLVSIASQVNANTNNLTLIGNRGGKTVVWTRVEENGTADNNPWALLPEDSYNLKTLPCLEGLQAVAYDGGVLATGGDLTTFYTSKDHGLTWTSTDIYALPATDTATQAALFRKSDNTLYCSRAGQAAVLSGRLARLGWKKQQTAFTE